MARRAYALDVIRAEIGGRWDGRDIRSDGWIGNAEHAARDSDHNPNDDDVVQAIDVDEHTDKSERSDEVGRWLWDELLASQDPRIKFVIYERRMFSSYASRRGPAWTVGPASGHTQHLHLSVVDDPKLYDSRVRWFAIPTTTPPKDDAMTPAQESKLDVALSQLAWLRDKTSKTNGAVGRMEAVHGQGLADLSAGRGDGGGVNVEELADALSEQLGEDLARALGRILSGA
jgi:hypothetical protein